MRRYLTASGISLAALASGLGASLEAQRADSLSASVREFVSVAEPVVALTGVTVIDGTGAAPRPADVGVLGDRILAVGDLSAVDAGDVTTVLDVSGRAVTPGFIDPHGHSDGSLFLDGALDSHLSQGFTTQLSGNCGDSLAPITDRGRELVELSGRMPGRPTTWSAGRWSARSMRPWTPVRSACRRASSTRRGSTPHRTRSPSS